MTSPSLPRHRRSIALPFALLLAVGCGGGGDGGTPDCVPAAEVCDGVDNDCNASTADGSADPLAGVPCDGADSDLCAEGSWSCTSGAMTCGDATGGALDTCNGLDDDCDAASDDGAEDPLAGVACDGPDSDLCAEGSWSCNSGTMTCGDSTGGALDACNGLDDDCDAASDDGAEDPLAGVACDGPDSDLCAEGSWSCNSGTMTCGDATSDSVEICNGIDDDCNGIVNDIVKDGSFEGGRTSAAWAETSIQGAAVRCDDTDPACFLEAGFLPSQGSWLAIFGDFGTRAETATLTQSVVVPAPVGFTSVLLRYKLRVPFCASASDTLEVRMNADVVNTHAATGALCGGASYEQQSVSITTYGNFSAHSLQFRGTQTQSPVGRSTWLVDEVEIVCQ